MSMGKPQISASIILSLELVVSFPKNDSVPDLRGGGRVELISSSAANPPGTKMEPRHSVFTPHPLPAQCGPSALNGPNAESLRFNVSE